MADISYFPLHTSLEQAQGLVLQPDWPGAHTVSLAEMTGELLWVPFDIHGGRAEVDASEYPEMANIILPLSPSGVNVQNAKRAAELPDSGRVITPRGSASLVYVPFWLLRTEKPSPGWVAINAYEGSLALGDLPAEPRAARAHLVFYLVLAMFCCFWGSDMFIRGLNACIFAFYSLFATIQASLTGVVPSSQNPSHTAGGVTYQTMGAHTLPPLLINATTLLAVALLGVIIYFLYRLIPHILREPTVRAATGRVVLPVEVTKTIILRACGYVALAEAIPDIILLCDTRHLNLGKSAFIFGDLIISILFGIAALLLGRAAASPSPLRVKVPRKGKAFYPTGPVPELVLTFSYITLGSVMGYMTVMAMVQTGFWMLHRDLLFGDPNMCIVRFIEIGAFMGVLAAPLAKDHRIPLILGSIASQVGDFFFGSWGGLLITLITVGITCMFVVKQVKRASGFPGAFWNSLRLSYGFSLWGAVGSVAGRLIAVFILGIFAIKLGEIVGQVIASLAGFISQERSIEGERAA
jgi:hypothetical protein